MDILSQTIKEFKQEQFCAEMMQRLNVQRMNDVFCDVTLEVSSGDEIEPLIVTQLKAHRIVLSAASPFFYNALNSDMKERKEGVIRLNQTSKSVMEAVLQYLYTGHVDVTEDHVLDLIAIADYLLLSSLKTVCVEFTKQVMSVSNCFVYYYSALKYRCPELEKEARNYILANFVSVSESSDFLNLSCEQVEEWISSDDIVIKKEEEVFRVILKWIESDENTRSQYFSSLFRHLRCVFVSRDYLFNVVLQNRFVKDDNDCLNVVLDAMKWVSHGTDECFISQSPRSCLKTHEDAIVACGQGEILCYIPPENEWYQLADMVSRRKTRHAMSTCHGKLYVVGANDDGQVAAECYTPTVDCWNPIKAPGHAMKFTSVVTFQGFVYVIGGLSSDGDDDLDTVKRYNPDTNEWQEMPSLSSPRSFVCSVADGNHLYIIGGKTDTEYLDIAERFDPDKNCWNRIASTHAKRAGACVAAVNGKVFLIGGKDEDGSISSCEAYDVKTEEWTVISSLCKARFFASAVSFKGLIIVFGGLGEDSWEKSFEIFDLKKNEWRSCTNLPEDAERYNFSTIRLPRNILNHPIQAENNPISPFVW